VRFFNDVDKFNLVLRKKTRLNCALPRDKVIDFKLKVNLPDVRGQ